MRKLVIFDMDGTILDTLDDLADALNVTLRKYRYPERTGEEVRSFVGNGIRKLIERSLPEHTSEERTQQVFASYVSYYQEHCCEKTGPYPGIVPLLQKLREEGYLTAVVSNKVDTAVQELCGQFFDGLFDFAAGEREGVNRKPAPDLVELAVRTLQADAAVYVGDSEVDLETARNAGLPCISVTWGFRDREKLLSCGAETFANTPEEVLQCLQRIGSLF